MTQSSSVTKADNYIMSQAFICPEQTHYYYRGACVRRCVRANSFECMDDTAGKTFNAELEVDTTIDPNGRQSTIDLGYGMFAYENLPANARCSDSQLELGRKCISKSTVIANYASIKDCVITDNGETDFAKLCTEDRHTCNMYSNIEIEADVFVHICAKDNSQVDCVNSNYRFDTNYQRFECYHESCDRLTVDGKFCYPACSDKNQQWLFDKCVSSADILNDTLNIKYQMLKGNAYAPVENAKFIIELEPENMNSSVVDTGRE